MCEGCAEDMYIKQLPQLMLSGGSISSLAWGTGQELPEGLEEPVSVSVPSSPFFAVLIKCAPKPCRNQRPYNNLVAEWIHFTLFGIILTTIKLKVYIFWGL